MTNGDFSVGLEVLQKTPSIAKDWGRVGLLSNQASVTKDIQPAWSVLKEILGSKLICLLGPQHGMESTVQDNMCETSHSIHKQSGLPVYSLYSETRSPTQQMLSTIDTLVIDLQLTGCRVYTFKYTIAACLRECKKYDKKVVLLDRVNPMGGTLTEGNVLDESLISFVGEFPIPMRYALSAGEITKFFNKKIGADLEVVTLQNWNFSPWKKELTRSWIYTSPNIPSLESLYCYCGEVLFEGTSVSEGRGTTLPFQLIGSSSVENNLELIEKIYSYINDGSFYLRATQFQPTFNKHTGKICNGFQIHVLDPDSFPSYTLGLACLKAFVELDKKFSWKQPPYEYNFNTLPIKLITGISNVDSYIKKDFDIHDPLWSKGIKDYLKNIEDCLLYDRKIISYIQ